MSRIIAVIVLIALFLLGIIKLFFELRNMERDYISVINFKENIKNFESELMSIGFNNEIYEYLNLNSSIIQNIIGIFGVGDMKPPYANYFIPNYQIIVNEINNFYIYYERGIDKLLKNSIISVNSSITKYIGYQNNEINKLKKDLKNPIVWLREGIRYIVLFPIEFLYWTDIIKYSNYIKIKDNIIFKIFSVAIGTLGFIGTVITIVTGYESFIKIIQNLIK